uniref:SKP1 component POZ domain-containing protein n=1 Tax=Romanomermis culicivorax TaxID=13658 RepID=A0A915JC91_ROMCU
MIAYIPTLELAGFLLQSINTRKQQPPMANKKVKLQSSDGELFEVEIDVIRMSNTIKTMLEDGFQPAPLIFNALKCEKNSDVGSRKEPQADERNAPATCAALCMGAWVGKVENIPKKALFSDFSEFGGLGI